ncbi:hypothetical protein IC582_002300 [Cucumis melo]
MHDLMHDLACSITNNECVHGLKGNVIDKRTRHFLLEEECREDQLMGPLSKATHVRTFFRHDHHDEVGSQWNFKEIFGNIFRLRALHLQLNGEIKYVKSLEFIGKLKHLRYLRIRGSNNITYLPDSIIKLYNLETFIFQSSRLKIMPSDVGNLINLKHLDLSFNHELEFLPNSITELYNLEALILEGCHELKELPEGIKRLINLKHLHLRRCWTLTHMPKGLGELSNLQTLNRFVLENNDLKELDGLTKLRGKLSIELFEFCTNIDQLMIKGKLLLLKSGLQELKLKWRKHIIGDDHLKDVIDESVLDCLQPHSNLQRVSIKGYGGVKLCNWISSEFLGCLVTICLINCERLKHLPRFDQFPNLKYLTLEDLPNIEYIVVNNDDFVSSSKKFPSLEELKILNMPKLVRWCKGPAWLGNLTSLVELDISHCKELALLPEGIQHIHNLQCLRIRNCPILKERCEIGTGEDWHKIAHIRDIDIR